MWVMTPEGFFSAVQKYGDDTLTIRARAREDLKRLQATYGLEGKIDAKGGTDYPYRIAGVTHDEWARVTAAMATSIDYSNFKDAVKKRRGSLHAQVFGRIWGVLLDLEDKGARQRFRSYGYSGRSRKKPATTTKKSADTSSKFIDRGPSLSRTLFQDSTEGDVRDANDLGLDSIPRKGK